MCRPSRGFGLLRDAPRLGARGQFLVTNSTKHFLKKKNNVFFLTQNRTTSWAPASQGRSLAATFYATCPRVLLLLQFTHFLTFRSCPGVPCSGGTPERVFLHFFRKGFRTRACTDIICILAQKRLFCNVKKVCACLRL